MRKEIIIIPGATDLNRGDQALVWESMEILKDSFSDSTFCILESGTKENDIILQSKQTRRLDVEMLKKILKHPSRISEKWLKNSVSYSRLVYVLWGIQSIYDLLVSSFQLSKFKFVKKIGSFFLTEDEKYTISKFKTADLIVVKGGGFIHSYGKLSDFYAQYFSLYHALLALGFKKKVIILPNSIGPVKGVLTKYLVSYVLKKSSLLTVREEVSKNYLSEKMRIKSDLFPDLGFYLRRKEGVNYEVFYRKKNIPLNNKKLVGLTLRPYRFPNSDNPLERYQNYIMQFSILSNELILRGYHLIFFAHTLGPSSHEDDRIALNEVIQNIDQEKRSCFSYVEDSDLDSKDLMGIYSHLDFMIGTRFHSVIFALNMEVPSIAIAYGGNKSFGIMKEMHLVDFVFPIEDFYSGDILKAIKKIEINRIDYLSKIKVHRRYLDLSRKELVSRIKKMV